MQKRTRLVALSLTIAWALSACVSTPPPSRDGQDVALGQTAYVDGPLVRPVSVLEDSRCPSDVQCVWAGRVRVQMQWLRPNGDQQEFDLNLSEPHSLADGQITLTAVRPVKQSKTAIAASDYRFTFRFEGGL
jgi:hypothetical protein